MTIGMRPICVDCVHFWPKGSGKPGVWGLYCGAYPEPPGIPDTILFTQVDHRQPQPGDHGIRFQAIDEEHEKDALLVLSIAEDMRAFQAERRKQMEAQNAPVAAPPVCPCADRPGGAPALPPPHRGSSAVTLGTAPSRHSLRHHRISAPPRRPAAYTRASPPCTPHRHGPNAHRPSARRPQGHTRCLPTGPYQIVGPQQ
ncbi:MAG TPA: hypothetical protein VF916_12990 [Ktedonobacterales bacterium]